MSKSVTQKISKKQRLLDQGVSLLMEKGYHGSGLKEILDTVQIPKGSFYTYFSSKEQFAAEVIVHYIEPFIERLNGHLHNPQLNGLQALQLYYAELVAEVARLGFKGGCLLGNLMGEIGDTSSICRDVLQHTVNRYRDLQAEALLRQDLSAETMADFLFNHWQGALLRMKVEQSLTPLQQCCDALLGDYFQNKHNSG